MLSAYLLALISRNEGNALLERDAHHLRIAASKHHLEGPVFGRLSLRATAGPQKTQHDVETTTQWEQRLEPPSSAALRASVDWCSQ